MNSNGYSLGTGWSETTFDSGVVKKNSIISHTFIYNGDKTIKRIVPLCSCLKVTNHHPKYTIWMRARNKTDDLKKITKMVEVRYTDDSRSFLIIKATITNEN